VSRLLSPRRVRVLGVVALASAMVLPFVAGTGWVHGEHTADELRPPMIVVPGMTLAWANAPDGSISIPAFEICQTEVSAEQYRLVTGRDCEEGCPTWFDAATYLNALTRMENQWRAAADQLTECYDDETWELKSTCTGYRLPTVAEWEHAVPAGMRADSYAEWTTSREVKWSAELIGPDEFKLDGLKFEPEYHSEVLGFRCARGVVAEASANLDSLDVHVRRLGDLDIQVGDLSAVRERAQRSFEVAEALTEANLNHALILTQLSVLVVRLAAVEFQMGNLTAARERLQYSFEIIEDGKDVLNRDMSIYFYNLAILEVWAGNLSAARMHIKQSLELAETSAKERPNDLLPQRDLSLSLAYLGDVEFQLGNSSEARKLFQRSFEITEQLAKANPDNAPVQRDLCYALIYLGAVDVDTGSPDAARDRFQRALEITEALVTAHPDSALSLRDLSRSLLKLGELNFATDNSDAAREQFLRARGIAEDLVTRDPENALAQHDLSLLLIRLGDVDLEIGNSDAARESWQRSLEIAETLAKSDPDNVRARKLVIDSHVGLVRVALAVKDTPALQRHLAAADSLLAELEERGPARRNLKEVRAFISKLKNEIGG
jgi:tetratricopeptide (TPR) repeat protein